MFFFKSYHCYAEFKIINLVVRKVDNHRSSKLPMVYELAIGNQSINNISMMNQQQKPLFYESYPKSNTCFRIIKWITNYFLKKLFIC